MNDLLKVVIVAVIGGAIPVFIKVGTNVMPPFTFVVLRLLVALAVLIPFYLMNMNSIMI